MTTPRQRWPDVKPQLPQYPLIFVAPHSDDPQASTEEAYCDLCAAPLHRRRGGYVQVFFGAVSCVYCPQCLVTIASEICARRGVKP